MRKIIVFILFFISALFFLRREVLAACQISAPDSADYNSQITVNINQVPSPPANQMPGLSVRDSNGNEIGCYPLAWPDATALGVGLPSAGTHAILSVEMRECTSALCYSCGQFISGPDCTKTVNLTGAPPGAPSCSVAVTQSRVTVATQDLSCAEIGYCFSVLNPNGFSESTQCKYWGGQCTGSMVVDFIPQAGWQSGVYTVEVRKSGTHGELVTSCSFNYTAPGATPPAPTPTPSCDDPQAIKTAIGCINVSGPSGFVSSVLKLALGVGGGIALLLIIFGAFQILASSGNPEKIKAGKELITSAIAGLLMIIFSLFLLQLIGVKILQIPGFGTP